MEMGTGADHRLSHSSSFYFLFSQKISSLTENDDGGGSENGDDDVMMMSSSLPKLNRNLLKITTDRVIESFFALRSEQQGEGEKGVRSIGKGARCV